MPTPDEVLSMFGDEIPQMDALRQNAKNVSQSGEALKGPGGPFDDMIPAEIEHPSGEVQPAKLSPGEFVLRQPAVALLGDGDPEAGASLLDILQNNENALSEVKSILHKYKLAVLEQ